LTDTPASEKTFRTGRGEPASGSVGAFEQLLRGK
jgi:hypothetical protein